MFNTTKDSLIFPSPPNWKMIEADLSTVNSSDVIFQISCNSNTHDEKLETNWVSNKVFEVAQELHSASKMLADASQILKTEVDNTNVSVDSLKATVQEVKCRASQVKEKSMSPS